MHPIIHGTIPSNSPGIRYPLCIPTLLAADCKYSTVLGIWITEFNIFETFFFLNHAFLVNKLMYHR